MVGWTDARDSWGSGPPLPAKVGPLEPQYLDLTSRESIHVLRAWYEDHKFLAYLTMSGI
jgi:hypothetical protein